MAKETFHIEGMPFHSVLGSSRENRNTPGYNELTEIIYYLKTRRIWKFSI
jgi:hypothetical protein